MMHFLSYVSVCKSCFSTA